jgi:hypothetical protein
MSTKNGMEEGSQALAGGGSFKNRHPWANACVFSVALTKKRNMRRIMQIAPIALLFILSITTPIAWAETFWVYKKNDGTEVTTSKWEYIPKEYRAGAYQKEVDPNVIKKNVIKKEESVKANVRDSREERIKFAELYKEKLLDSGMNAYVLIDGKNATILILEWILIDRPFVHNFGKSDIIRQMGELGFKIVILKGGYGGGQWIFDLRTDKEKQEYPFSEESEYLKKLEFKKWW